MFSGCFRPNCTVVKQSTQISIFVRPKRSIVIIHTNLGATSILKLPQKTLNVETHPPRKSNWHFLCWNPLYSLWQNVFYTMFISNIWLVHQNKNRRWVIVLFRQAFSSLTGNIPNNAASTHISGERLESCLSQSSTCAPRQDARWRSIQISAGPPLGDGCNQIPEGNAIPPSPSPDLTLIGA
jgi:hypothetical protein